MLSLQSLQREGRSAEVDAVTDEPFLVVPCGIFFLLFFFFSPFQDQGMRFPTVYSFTVAL